jgi:hypothetical protein
MRTSKNDNNKQEIDRIISTAVDFSLEIVVGVSNIVAERNSEINANDPLPPVLPLDLCLMDREVYGSGDDPINLLLVVVVFTSTHFVHFSLDRTPQLVNAPEHIIPFNEMFL